MKQTIEFFRTAADNPGGLSEEQISLLFLVPLVETAWAHGAVSEREKQAIFECARRDGIDERHWFNEKLNEWLIYRPSRLFFQQCLEMMGQVLSDLTVRKRAHLRLRVLDRCRDVAAAAGGRSPMDVNFHVSTEEKAVLENLEEVLR